MVRDQSCLEWITIKSRTCKDHEELRILVKNCLIPSRFNQEFFYKDKEHSFIKHFPQKSETVRSDEEQLDGHDRALKVSHDPMTRAHILSLFRSSDLDQSLLMKTCVDR